MPVITPEDEVPGSTGNDVVMDQNNNMLYAGQPLDVKTWLLTPGNMGDTTRTIINYQTAAVPFAGTMCYASEYLANWDLIYPSS